MILKKPLTAPILCCSVCLCFLFPGKVSAQASNNPFSLWYLNGAPSGWRYDLVLGAEYEPTYTGSKNYVSSPSFNVRAIYKSESGRRYSISLGEIGVYVPLKNDWLLAGVLEYEEGRESSEEPLLTEFPEVENTVEGQFSITKKWGNMSAGFVLQPDILDKGKGLVYFLGGAYDKTYANNLRTYLSVDVSFADQEHLQTEIGVPASVTNKTGIATYSPSSGYKSTTLDWGLAYPLGKKLELFSNVGIEFYGSNMKMSPLISEFGSSTNYEIEIGLRYQF